MVQYHVFSYTKLPSYRALHGLEVYTETADKYYYTAIKVHCSTVMAKVSIAVKMVMSYMQIKHPFHTKVYDTIV